MPKEQLIGIISHRMKAAMAAPSRRYVTGLSRARA
jgi:hypothetical protein